MRLSGANSYNGSTTISQSVLSVNTLANGGANSAIGASTSAAANLVIGNDATLRYTGAAANTDRSFTISGGTATLEANGSGPVSFTNTATPAYGTADQARTLGLAGTNSGTNTLAALIADNGTGMVSIVKSGTGTWVLSNANTYTGTTWLTGGLLSGSAAANFGAASAPLVFNGGGLQVTGTSLTTLSGLGRPVTLSSGSIATLDIAAAANAFTLDQALVTGGAGLTKRGDGTLVLNLANTYTGATTISGGTLQVGVGSTAGSLAGVGQIFTNATLAVSRSGTVTQSAVLGPIITGTGGVTNVGPGTLVLDRQNIYSGITRAASGTIQLSNALAIQNSAIDTNGSGKFVFNGSSSQLIGGLSGTGSLADDFDPATYGAVSNLTLNVASGGTVTYGGVILNGDGGMNLTIAGLGTQTLRGANSYTGTTTLGRYQGNAGTLVLSGSGSLLNSSAYVFAGGGLTLTNTNSNEGVINRLGDSVPITANGGTLTYNNTTASGTYAEAVGDVTVSSGQFNVVLGSNVTGNQRLAFSNLSRDATTSGSTAAVTFSAAATGPQITGTGNRIVVTGLASTGTSSGQILGPWATVGTAVGTQTDYAISVGGTITGARYAANNTETSWAIGSGTAFTITGTGIALSGNRSGVAFRYANPTSGTLSLGANQLQTYGLLTGSGGSLSIAATSGALTTPSGGGNLFVTTGNGGITISGSVADNSGAAVTLVKSNAGTLTLSATNSYSGGTVINGGVVSIFSDANLGATTGGITFNGAATLYSSTTTVALNADRTITVNNGAIASFQTLTGIQVVRSVAVAGKITGSGGIRVFDTYSVNSGSATFTSTLSDFTGPVVVDAVGGNLTAYMAGLQDGDGYGNVVLTGGNFTAGFYYTGNTPLVLSGRQLELAGALPTPTFGGNGSGAITVNRDLLVSGAGDKTLQLTANTASGTNTFAGLISNGNSSSLGLKTSAGTWLLSGTNTYTGQTDLGTGTLVINTIRDYGVASAIGLGTAGTPIIGGFNVTGSLVYTGTGDSTNRNFLFQSYSAGSAATVISNNGSGPLVFTAGTFAASNGTGNNKVYALTIGGTYTGGANEIQGVIQNSETAGSLSLTKADASTWILSGNNTYTGATTVNAGVLGVGSAEIAGTSGPLGRSGSIVLGGGTLQYSPANQNDYSGRFSTAAGQRYNVDTNGQSVTWATPLTSSGGSLTKSGSGTLTLTGSSTYVGLTSVSGGTLSIGGGGALATTGTVNLAASGVTFDISNASDNRTVGMLTGTAGSTVALGGNSLVVGNATSGTFAGEISGAGGLTKRGSGTFTLAGANTFSGTTTLNVGVLALGSANALGGGGAIVFTGGTLQFTATGTPDVAAQVRSSTSAMTFDTNGQSVTFTNSLGSDNTAGLTKVGSGTLTLAGNNSYAGTTTISAGVLRVGGSGTPFGVGTVNLGNSGGIGLDINGQSVAVGILAGGGTGGGVVLNSGTLLIGTTSLSGTYAGAFIGPGSVVKTGGGGLYLNPTVSSTMSGLLINQGLVSIAPANGITLDAGTITRTSGGAVTFPLSTTGTIATNTPLANGIIGPWAVASTTTNLRYATVSGGTVAPYTSGSSVPTGNIAQSLADSTGTINYDLQTGVTTGTAAATFSGNTIRYTGGSGTLSPGATSFAVNGLMNAGTGLLTFGTAVGNSGTIRSGTTRELVIATNTQSVTINSLIADSTSGSSGLTFVSQGGNLSLLGANTFTGDLNVTGGNLTLGSGSFHAATTGNVTLSPGATLTVNNNGPQSMGNIVGIGSTLTKTGTGVLTLSSATSSFTGAASLNGGTVSVSALGMTGNVGGLGTSGTINVGASGTTATLRYTGSGETTNRVINLSGTTGGATIEANGSGALVLSSAITATGNGATGNKTLTLAGTGTALNSIGLIPNPTTSGTMSVDKTGSGTWLLTGQNTYSGQLRVLDGTIVVGAIVSPIANSASPFGMTNGDAFYPLVGSTTLQSGTAALLLADGVTVGRDFTVVAPAAGSSQVVVLGGLGSGSSSFSNAGSTITLGRSVTLQAGSSGTVTFANGWGISGTTPTITIGTAGNAGTVVLNKSLPANSPVLVNLGTALLGKNDVVNPAAPLTVGSSLGAATFDINGWSQTLPTLAFAGNSGLVTNGTLRLGYSGTAAVTATGTGHEISSAVVLVNNSTFGVTNASDRLRVSGSISDTGGQSLTKTGLGTLELTGANTYSGATTINSGTLQLGSGGATGSLNTASTISGSTGGVLAFNRSDSIAQGTAFASNIAGGVGVSQIGPGTTTLASGNTYSGLTTVTAGVLAIAGNDAVPNTSALLVNGGGFNLGAFNDTVASVTLTSGSIFGAGTLTAPTYGLSGGRVSANLGSGTMTVTGNAALDGTTGATLVNLNAGTLTLGLANRFTSSSVAVTGSAGAGLVLGGNETIGSLAGGANVALGAGTLTTGGLGTSTLYTGTLSGAGGLTKTGAGTMTLGGVNTYTGTTTVSAGVLQLGVASALADTSTLLVNGGGFGLNGNSDTVGAVTITSGSIFGAGTLTAATYGLSGGTVAANLGTGMMTVTGNAALNGTSGATALNLNAGTLTLGLANRFTSSSVAVTGSAGAGLVLGGNETFGSLAGGANVALGAGTLTTGGLGTSTLYTGTLSGAGGLAKTGAGTMTLSAANTYSGPTTISGGTIQLGNAAALGTGALAVNAGGLDLNGQAVAIGMLSGSAGASVTSGVAGPASLTTTFSGNSTFAGAITNGAGTVGFEKAGAGTLALTGANTYSGATTVSGGVLQVGDCGTTGSLASSAVSVASGASLAFNRSDALSYSGAISGAGSLAKQGAGTLTLSASNSYAGGTRIDAGTVKVADAGALGSGGVALNAGVLDLFGNALRIGSLSGSSGAVVSSSVAGPASLISAATGDSTFAGVIGNGSGVVGFGKAGVGKLTFTAAQTFTGNTVISGGTVALGSLASLASGTIQVGTAASPAGTLDVTAVPGGLAVASTQTLGGYGTVLGDVVIANGATVSPGGSIGTLTTTGSVTFGGGGRYLFEITDATGSFGIGWDFYSVGALGITSGSANPFIVDLQTLANAGDDTPGLMTNWDNTQNYQWKFLVAAGTTFNAGNFDSSWFQVSAANFLNPIHPEGSFSVARGGSGPGGLGDGTTANELYIVYAAVPEPSTIVLAGLGLVVVGWHVCRRRAPG